MRIAIIQPAGTSSSILTFAAEEMRHFAGRISGDEVVVAATRPETAGADVTFELAVDPEMKPYSYAGKAVTAYYAGKAGTAGGGDAGKLSVTLRGNDEQCVLHAVYECLERLGVYFELTGPVLPQAAVDIAAAVRGMDFDITPFARFRSVKHYINFTNDLSIFSLAEAKDVIRNHARLKYNWITFTLLQGMWLPQFHAPDPDKALLTGNLFYNAEHKLPDDPFVRSVVDNRDTLYIPELEEAAPSRERRSRLATEWLNKLMEYAQSIGLRVQLALELEQETGREQDAETVCGAVAMYPHISSLEMLSAESGGPQVSQTAEEQREHLWALFHDEELLANPKVSGSFKSNLRQYWGIMHWLAKELAVIPDVKPYLDERGIGLVIGQYSKCYNTLTIGKEVMRKYTPPSVTKSALIGYGAVKVDTALDAIGWDAADWRDTILTNWFEFDGSMFLMQNAIAAIGRAVAKAAAAVGPGGQIEGMHMLTWRIGENRLTARFAVEALIDPAVTAGDFYRGYVRRFEGTGNVDAMADEFAGIMDAVETAENFCNYRMFNVGFCVPNVCYPNPADPLGGLGGDYEGAGREAEAMYGAAADRTQKLLQQVTSPVLIAYLRMLLNRLQATVLHFEQRRCAGAVVAICSGKTHADLTADERDRVGAILADAKEGVMRYILHIAAEMPDRGAQGLIMSYYRNYHDYYTWLEHHYVLGEEENRWKTPPFSNETGTDGGAVCPMPAE